jgi:hypothetical protein
MPLGPTKIRTVPKDEAFALLREIERWSVRTRTSEVRLGRILFNFPGFVGLLRKRLLIVPDKAQRVRRFLALHPSGANHIPLPPVQIGMAPTSRRIPRAAPPPTAACVLLRAALTREVEQLDREGGCS